MRLLLDTHTLFWSVEDPGKISAPAMAAMQDPENIRLLSAATIWELAIKVSLGKIRLSLPFRAWMEKVIHDLVLEILPLTVEYASGRPRSRHTTKIRSTGSLSLKLF
jgi:PIN domain nuclease of toxin-antitoxin system